MDNVIIALCNSSDYVASPLLMEKTITFNLGVRCTLVILLSFYLYHSYPYSVHTVLRTIPDDRIIAIGDFTLAISDGAISLCVAVVVTSCATD